MKGLFYFSIYFEEGKNYNIQIIQYSLEVE